MYIIITVFKCVTSGPDACAIYSCQVGPVESTYSVSPWGKGTSTDPVYHYMPLVLQLDTDPGDLEALLNMLDTRLGVIASNITELTSTATSE